MTAVSDPSTASPTGGKFNAFTERALTRLLQLPPKTTEYTVHRRVRVPMRDGVELLADHYEPTTSTPAGTLLVRCPYGRGFPFSTTYASLYAARGYHVVFQSVRGTFGSGGNFEPMVNEKADGADTVEWLRHQPWFTGSFATMGLSYLGFTQWALLADPPPELKAAIITVGVHDPSGPRWGTGSFGLNDFLGWSDLVAHQEDPRLRVALRQVRARRALARATSGLPAGEAGRALLGASGAAWWEDWLDHPEATDPFWAERNAWDALKRTDIPVLLIGGWQDVFLDQTLTQYDALKRRGVDVAMTVGSWTHSQIMYKGASTVARESLDWLDAHLGGRGTTRSPVRVQMNGKGWIELPEWPPAMPERVLYLQPTGRLGDAAPPDTAPPSRFTSRWIRHPRSAAGCWHPRAATAGTPSSPNDPTCCASPATGCRQICMSPEHRSSSCRIPATTRTTICSCASAKWTPRASPAT
jgi:putative CocE/NonD family hydrolase